MGVSRMHDVNQLSASISRACAGVLGKVALALGPSKFLRQRGLGRWGRQGAACVGCSKTWIGSLIQGPTPRGCMLIGEARQCGRGCARGHRAFGGSHSVRCVDHRHRCASVDGHRCDLGSLHDHVGEGGVHCRIVLGLKESRPSSRSSPVPGWCGRWRSACSALGSSFWTGCCVGADVGAGRWTCC